MPGVLLAIADWFKRLVKPAVVRAYDGAGTGRRLEDWRTRGTSANAEVAAGASSLRDRARDLVRNNPNASKAKREFVSALVGDGIRPRSATGIAEIDREVDALWSVTEPLLDAKSGRNGAAATGWYAKQATGAGGWFESGEVIQRRLVRTMDWGLPVPLQVELLEADHLDASITVELGEGRRVVQGVEFDASGGVVAYHILPRHPGESIGGFDFTVGAGAMGGVFTGGRAVRIEAWKIAHMYEELRPGQVRGIPWLTPVIVAMKDLDDAADAERVRMRIAACVTAFVYGNEVEEEGIATKVEDAEGNPIEVLEPGLIAYVRGGKDVKFPVPGTVTGWEGFNRVELTRIAAGLGTTYELISGDLSHVNFSSIRAGQIGFRRLIEACSALWFVPLFCAPVWGWFIEGAVGAGLLKPRPGGYPARWVRSPWREVDAQKHHTAIKLAMRNGTLTFPEAVTSETGRDWREVLAEHALVKTEVETLGLNFDSLPWSSTMAGRNEDTPVEDEDKPPRDPDEG